ncbi:hypothetical protein O1W71_16270 [Microbacterium sp. H37-C3]|uniref:hyaluronate lyase N-terminal domain-containing protein n=1 Tax=Microbacterium sp. H37-C3 TaxID=3004354 RepID=UPI0022AF677A|nr:hypothetical protein [Microbacterium sp. H37-C3]MCZ4069228.1 hypothetical protein [Microbacterium sp. H37-C3]
MTLAQITIRRGTTAEWAAANPVLGDGEMGYDSTLKRVKVGDGVVSWVGLGWSTMSPGEVQSVLTAATIIDQADTPTDASVANLITTPGSQTNTQLSAAFGDVLDAADFPGQVEKVAGELAYAQSITSTTLAVGTGTQGLTGVQINFRAPVGPFAIEIGGLLQYLLATGDPVLRVVDAAGATVREFHHKRSADNGEFVSFDARCRVAAKPPGTLLTYSLAGVQRASGTWQVLGSAAYPTWIKAVIS